MLQLFESRVMQLAFFKQRARRKKRVIFRLEKILHSGSTDSIRLLMVNKSWGAAAMKRVTWPFLTPPKATTRKILWGYNGDIIGCCIMLHHVPLAVQERNSTGFLSVALWEVRRLAAGHNVRSLGDIWCIYGVSIVYICGVYVVYMWCIWGVYVVYMWCIFYRCLPLELPVHWESMVSKVRSLLPFMYL